MRFNRGLLTIFTFCTTLQSVTGFPGRLRSRQADDDILIDPPEQPELPEISEVESAAAGANLNLTNIQGDILIGMKKNKEKFFFFSINDPATFKKKLKAAAGFITSTIQLLDPSKQPPAMVNVAFSQSGLNTLNVTDNLGDALFSAGQFAGAADLGDPGTDKWIPAFKGTRVHGVFLLASNSMLLIDAQWVTTKLLFGSSISELYTLSAQARPGSELGHEHFGFMDGISQPAVRGFVTNPNPGQAVVDAGRILVGEPGDEILNRPTWTKDGSFLVFRQLKQLVPEFNKFLADNPLSIPGSGLSPKQGSELLGARMVGRWKSGAPVDLAPVFDDPGLAKDPLRNNDFTFAHPGEDLASNQTRCPFSAHIRKTAPRADFRNGNPEHHIMRAGIPYGPEVSAQEARTNTTISERGLAFVAYQSDIEEGFYELQHDWANDPQFVHNKTDPTPGFDPIVGANNGAPRFVSGLDPTNPSRDFTLLIDFVQSRGGEYFFAPPISAITGILTA